MLDDVIIEKVTSTLKKMLTILESHQKTFEALNSRIEDLENRILRLKLEAFDDA